MRDPIEVVPKSGDSSLWYNLCLLGIGLSAFLYARGRKNLALFVGLWPPTFAALGNRAEVNEEITNLITGRPIQRLGGGKVTPQVGMGFGAAEAGPRPAA